MLTLFRWCVRGKSKKIEDQFQRLFLRRDQVIEIDKKDIFWRFALDFLHLLRVGNPFIRPFFSKRQAVELLLVFFGDAEKRIDLVHRKLLIPFLNARVFFHAGHRLVRIAHDTNPFCIWKQETELRLDPNGRMRLFANHLT